LSQNRAGERCSHPEFGLQIATNGCEEGACAFASVKKRRSVTKYQAIREALEPIYEHEMADIIGGWFNQAMHLNRLAYEPN